MLQAGPGGPLGLQLPVEEPAQGVALAAALATSSGVRRSVVSMALIGRFPSGGHRAWGGGGELFQGAAAQQRADDELLDAGDDQGEGAGLDQSEDQDERARDGDDQFASDTRSFCIPRRIRVLIVPSGACSRWAISTWVRPP